MQPCESCHALDKSSTQWKSSVWYFTTLSWSSHCKATVNRASQQNIRHSLWGITDITKPAANIKPKTVIRMCSVKSTHLCMQTTFTRVCILDWHVVQPSGDGQIHQSLLLMTLCVCPSASSWTWNTSMANNCYRFSFLVNAIYWVSPPMHTFILSGSVYIC